MRRITIWSRLSTQALREIAKACGDVANEYGRRTHLEVQDVGIEVARELAKRS